ncbi:MAG TPA: hypothetical protein VF954_04945, partial [Acidimicrobiales bacterium]
MAAALTGAVVLLLPSTAFAARAQVARSRSAPRTAATPALTIGVDNASPSGHNYLYTQFYPGSASTPTIHSGDVVDFQWNQGAIDGFHTATMLGSGENATPGDPSSAWAKHPFFTPDADNGEAPLVNQQTDVAFGTFPPAGSGAPGACGDAATPCPFAADTAPSDLNSGAAPTAPGNDFFVKFTAAGPTTVTFVCLIHPGMKGHLTVDSGAAATTPAEASAAATTAYDADNTAAAAQIATVPAPTPTANGDGTKTWTLTAGTATPHVEILEMLPAGFKIGKNDKVKWTTGTIEDVHTVTFPPGLGSISVDPFRLPPMCEAASGPDTVAPDLGGAPPFGCADTASLEFP